MRLGAACVFSNGPTISMVFYEGKCLKASNWRTKKILKLLNRDET